MQVADPAQSARPLMTRAGWKARCAGERRGGATAAVVAGALLLAGCGASSPTAGVAHLGSTKTATTSATGGSAASGSGSPGAQALKLSACMRSHGEPNFPDPEISTSGGATSVRIRVSPSSGIVPGSPTFLAAQKACRAFAPTESRKPAPEHALSTAEQAQVLKLAACIREHGEPNLPDPTFTGGGVHLPPSVDTHSATFKSAEQACQSLIPSSLRPGAGAGTRAGG
jgi:hypothetical protein